MVTSGFEKLKTTIWSFYERGERRGLLITRPTEAASFDLKVGSTPTIVQWNVPAFATVLPNSAEDAAERGLGDPGWWCDGGER